MSAPFPFVPLNGISPYVFLLMAGLVGLVFGWFLERAGFGSAKKITAVFTMRDWDVYRVMFTAVITAMIGAQLLGAVGLLDLGLLEISTTYAAAMGLGGILFGVGFYFGGFCPGTAVVAFVRGRLDGLVFLVGIILGIYGFALFFDGPGQASWFQSFFAPSDASPMTLVESPYVWYWVAGITLVVLLSFRYLYIFEQRFALRTPEELENATPRPAVVRPKAKMATRLAVTLTVLLVGVLGVLQIGDEEPEVLAVGSEIPAAVAVDSDAVPVVDPLSLAGWIVADANRMAEDKAPNSYVIDLRTDHERTVIPIRDALVLVPCEGTDDQFDTTLSMLNGVLTDADRNKPLVIVDDGYSGVASDLVQDLRLEGLSALMLDGGSVAWQDEVLAEDAVWPEWIVDSAGSSGSSEPVPSVADYHDDVRLWMKGETSVAPAYIAIPGTAQLPSEAATVTATGGGGGGCG
ncbi:MAG: YeeE/YedE thiosulfate transporter family protein [Actinomycetota bacterium]